MPEYGQRLLGLLAPRCGCRNRNNRACAQHRLNTTQNAVVASTFTPVLHALPRSYTGPSYLDDFESICLEEGNSASPIAYGYRLPLWVEGNAVQGLGTGVLESQLSTDCVPQLEDEEESGCWAPMAESLSSRAPESYLIQSPASAELPQDRQSAVLPC